MTVRKPKFFELRSRKQRGKKVVPWWLADRAPGDLCGGRKLSGREFERRKRELEAQDRERRRKADVVA